MTTPFTWTIYKGLGEAIVVSLDMRSSSWIVDDLQSAKNLERLGGFWGEIKHFLGNELQKRRGLKFTPYKFIGDSWVLLFLPDTPGQELLTGLHDLCTFYDRELAGLLSHLTEPPARTGIAFGVDAGSLLATTIFGNDEYLARCINVAARLQARAKSLQDRFSMLVSASCYDTHFAKAAFPSTRMSCDLVGMRKGSAFQCVQVNLN